MSANNFSIENEARQKVPRFDFETIKNDILGEKYELTLIFTNSSNIKKLNTIYRDKEHATDILSFPLSETEGEIYICQSEARKEATKFERTFENFIPFLFIHGCVHLKGYDHGGTMESIEKEIRHRFKI